MPDEWDSKEKKVKSVKPNQIRLTLVEYNFDMDNYSNVLEEWIVASSGEESVRALFFKYIRLLKALIDFSIP